MADKQVNININYKVNTVEVEKAQVLLKQAQTASNTFEQSAKKAGTTTSQSFKTAGLSIQEMNAKLAVLKERINQSADAKAVKRLSDEYKKLKTEIDAANKSAFQTPKALNESAAATKSLAGQFGQLYTAVKLVLTAGLIKEIATTAIEMAKLSGNVEGVSRAFNRAFPDAESVLFRLRKATRGTVDDFQLMQRTLQATNLGVAVEQLPILFEFAAARAQQTGESVDYLVDSIVRGIGRKSILVLDNLGLSATRLKEQFNGASLASQSVADVTKGVAAIAAVELQKMGGYAETSATQVDQLTTSFTKLRIELSQSIAASSFVTFVKGYVDSFGLLLEARRKGNTVAEQAQENLRMEIAQMSAAEFTQRNLTKSKEENNKILQEEIQNLTKEVGAWASFRDEQEKQIETLKELKKSNEERVKQGEMDRLDASVAATEINKEIEFRLKLIEANKEDALTRQELIKLYQAQLLAGQKITKTETEQLGIIEQLQEDIETLGDKIKKAHSVTDIENYNRQLVILEARLKELNELGKNFVNPFASQVFDIKKNFGTKIYLEDLVNTQTLEEDTEKLFGELGAKAAESFDLGVANAKISESFLEAIERRKEELLGAGIDITANALSELASMEADSYNQRLRMLGDYYDQQIFLAGDNDKAKDRLRQEEKKKTDKLRREEAKKEQQARLYQILINTAAGIAKAFATSATVYDAYINAGIIAVEGAAQYAIASKSPRGFAKGVLNLNGPGTGTSDSIPSRLSKGESVMTAQEWKTSKNVLKAVRAKKLDDKVLADLKLSSTGVTNTAGFNDKNIISKLDEVKNSFPDIEERAGLIYTSKTKGKNYRLMVRKSSMSS